MRALILLLWATACQTKAERFPGLDTADTGLSAEEPPPTDLDRDGSPAELDCDDRNPVVSPDLPELCDGVDNDCDGEIDEADALDAIRWRPDLDGDGFGDSDTWTWACEAPDGAVAVGDDCDDTDPNVNPVAPETCDGLDDDCDGEVDEPDAVDASPWYADSDGDGYGDPAARTDACAPPSGFVADPTDCDDGDPATSPGAPEVCGGGDEDCDGDTDEDDASDAPIWYLDADRDGYGDPLSSRQRCRAPAGMVSLGTDCDDDDAEIWPGAAERCNFLDDSCDGDVDEGLPDLDGSGFADCKEVAVVVSAAFGLGGDGVSCEGTTSLERELQELETDLAAMGLSLVRVDETFRAGIDLADIAYYPVVVYHTGGWAAPGSTDTITALTDAVDAGAGLLVLGEDAGRHADRFSDEEGDDRLFGLMWASSWLYDGTRGVGASRGSLSHAVLDGRYGHVHDWAWLGDLDHVALAGDGEQALMYVQDSLLPVVWVAEDGDQRTAVILASRYSGRRCPVSDTAGLQDLGVLFQNSVAWLMGW